MAAATCRGDASLQPRDRTPGAGADHHPNSRMPDQRPPPATDASLLPTHGVESDSREVNGVRLHVVTAGDPDAPLVVLLHGHPDFWYGWRDQIGPLVDAGYRVLVPDQRGCNLSEAPEGIDPYRIPELAADVRELIQSEGRESAHVVGHDFGAFVAWTLALREPAAVDRLGILNVPHPTVYRETLRSSLRQIFRSWYVWFYQLPKLPEWALGRDDMDGMVSSLELTSTPDTFDDEEIRRYRAAWEHTGIEPRINWYRGFRRSESPPRDTVTQPTLICWGEDDIALQLSMAEASLDYCEDGELRTFPDASHWVQHDECGAVTDALLDHLS